MLTGQTMKRETVDMVLETTGHCSAHSQYTPIPKKLFRAEPSLNATGMEGSMDVALLIASLRLLIAAGTQKIFGPTTHPFLKDTVARTFNIIFPDL